MGGLSPIATVVRKMTFDNTKPVNKRNITKDHLSTPFCDLEVVSPKCVTFLSSALINATQVHNGPAPPKDKEWRVAVFVYLQPQDQKAEHVEREYQVRFSTFHNFAHEDTFYQGLADGKSFFRDEIIKHLTVGDYDEWLEKNRKTSSRANVQLWATEQLRQRDPGLY
jgi:hypothetical protein